MMQTQEQVRVGADLDITTGDFVLGPDGDLVLVAGTRALQQRLYLRARTVAGDLLLHPGFGCGAGALLERPLSDAAAAQLAGALQTQLAAEDAVESVLDVQCTQPTPGVLQIDVFVLIRGAQQPALLSAALGVGGQLL